MTDPGHRRDTDPGHRETFPPGRRDGDPHDPHDPHDPPGHYRVPPNQSVPVDGGSRADYGHHNPFEAPNPAPDPGVRISMPAPVVEPDAPVTHPHAPDYQVTSAPHHSTAPADDLWRTGSHTAYHDVAAPESAPWLPGAHAPRIDASMDSSPLQASAYVPRIDAVIDSNPWSAAHEPRIEAVMTSGISPSPDAWLPSEAAPHAAPFGPLNGDVHHAPNVVSAVGSVVGSVGRYVSDTFQPTGSFTGASFQPSGSFGGGSFPGDPASSGEPAHHDAVVASSGVLTQDERVSADRLYG